MRTLPKAGRYELLEEIGRGAMGVVYKAHDPVIGRPVAVKTMRLSEEGTGMTHAELIARFQTEARAAGLLAHPNIVVVHDAGEEEGLFYITMELVEGRSLQALLDSKQSFPLARALRLVEQACSALEFAHQRNVVHRDIKPANLMLLPDDTVKITDFGTAKILQFGTAQTAHIIGTPSYMSPEQVKGKLVDGRSDIFSLGVILYELVTGEKPFPGQNITTVIYKIVNEDPIPPRELDSSVHPGLSYVITRALAKEPDARYQSCRELQEALGNYRNLGAGPETTVVVVAPAAGAASSVAATGTAGHSTPATQRPLAASERTGALTAEPKPRNKRAEILLALVLLAIIAGTCYHLWPYMLDLWERSRATSANYPPETIAPSQPPGVQTQSPNPPPPATPNPMPPELPATEMKQQDSPATKSGVEKGEDAKRSEPAPAKIPPPPTVQAPPRAKPVSPESGWRLQQRLARAGLADKVRVRIVGRTVTLEGRLTPAEHGRLLQMLRNSPPWVRVIDHIEDESPGPGANNR